MKTEKNSLFSVRSMVITALFSALICIAAPFSIQIGAVPISLGTFAIYLAGALLGAKRGVISVTVYIMLGAAGLPVFTGFTGGFAKLLGATGGYIIGYIPLVLLTGIFAEKSSKYNWKGVAGMFLGTAALYTFGTAWFIILTRAALTSALLTCVVPFLAGDTIKIICTSLLSVPLKARLRNIFND